MEVDACRNRLRTDYSIVVFGRKQHAVGLSRFAVLW